MGSGLERHPATFGYTNHTLLPEALETWPIEMFGNLLPRHLEIVYEINRRFLTVVRTNFPGDDARVARMSLIAEGPQRFVRMANLATVAAFKVNGVAALHSNLLKQTVLRDFYDLWPERFTNVTNGVTPRRFLALANPPLARSSPPHIGDTWLKDLDDLRKLEPLAEDPEFARLWSMVKQTAKSRFAAILEDRTGISVDPASLFDVQAKRLHEYKRQHLNALFIVAQYLRLKRDPMVPEVPRTFIFGGKAAPGYAMAKLIIKLINAIASVVNADPQTQHLLRVAFFPDFNVKNAQHIYPAADLSEQISTAGKEASGTGNMKFSMNGALTIGTPRRREHRDSRRGRRRQLLPVRADRRSGPERKPTYRPRAIYDADAVVREALDYIGSGAFANGDASVFRPLVDNLRDSDPFLVLADFESYLQAQARVSELWRDQKAWTRQSILNVARIGTFSSDRSVRDYAKSIWRLEPFQPTV